MSSLNMSDEELKDWVFKVNTEFYELVYNDLWFMKIFRNIKQEIITSQQTDFMVQALGGPKMFCGRPPKDAHPHIWIDEDMMIYREQLLIQAFEKVGAPEELRDKWLKIDEAFKHVLINKGGPETCFKRGNADEIIYEPKPYYVRIKKAS